MHRKSNRKGRGFSLVELVIVIVIIGIIAAIAIPRVSRGSRGASESSLSSDLAVMRNAVELYASEHNGVYPGSATDGTAAAESAAAFESQLLKYSDIDGKTSASRDATHIYGPYLRKGIPPLPVGSATVRGSTAVAVDKTNSPPAVATGTDGWVYNPKTGEIIANTADPNEKGDKNYNDF
jgi:general secretion pathway protein G